jgi:hypothetical protein
LSVTPIRRWRVAHGDAPAAVAARHEFVRRLIEIAAPDSDVCAAETIFGELVANALEHGVGVVTAELYGDGGDVVPPSRTRAKVHAMSSYALRPARHSAAAGSSS